MSVLYHHAPSWVAGAALPFPVC